MAIPATITTLLEKPLTHHHLNQLHAYLTTTGHLSNPSLRVLLLSHPSLSSPTALALLDSTPNPTTNDFNALIRSHAASDPILALRLFRATPRPDALSDSFALKASAHLSCGVSSALLHSHSLKQGFLADVILRTTLVDAYSKSSDLVSAEKVFEEMGRRDVATWNALICGFAAGSRPHDAIAAFKRLVEVEDGSTTPKPNDVTVVGALSACAQLGAAKDAEFVLAYINRDAALSANVRVANAVIDALAKCGRVDEAVGVFRSMRTRTVVSWNSAIMALSMHGRGTEAVRLFAETDGVVEPDTITYLSVLSGCNHSGLVEDGLRIFNTMRCERNQKHYGAVVALLGRAGRLSEAVGLVNSMPFPPDAVLWQTLLGACKMHGDVELAERVSGKLAELGSSGDGDYVLLSNVYAASQRWEDVGRVREAMRSKDVRKIPGFSYLEVGGVAHRFLNGDKQHERWPEISRSLDDMWRRIRQLGYVANTSSVLHDIGEEEKENEVFFHSEKLAIAFGLVCLPEGEAVQVFKNLTICGDCHCVAKLVSKAFGRVIVVRDRARFHRFEDGSCSCGDYW